MRLDDIRENVKLIDKIDKEIAYLETFTDLGVCFVAIKPNYEYERKMPDEMMDDWFHDELIEIIESRMQDLYRRKKFLMREIGVTE